MPTIDISAGTIHYEAIGPENGRPVVFVHGYMMGGQLWRQVSERLAEVGLRCIAPTWPLGAHPEPLRPGADRTINGVAGIVADVLAALDLRDVVLVGNDTGGVVTQLVAVHHRERIGALVLTSCDIRIASERASFAESFVQLGLIPGDGGSWFLQRVVGYQRAAEMTFTGDRIDASTALAWGLVTRVVPHDDLLPAAHELAERIAKNPPHALRMAKRLLQESRTGSLESTLGMAAAMQPLAHRDPEHEQRIAKWRTR
jgi:pimeloyl-ACP methyl ester carboxylesterase